MAEYIEREAVNALIKAECSPKVAAYLIDAVATIHAAAVRPVARGRWRYEEKELKNGVVTCFHTCSMCGYHTNLFVIKTISKTPYYFCPNCGADMRPEPPKEET